MSTSDAIEPDRIGPYRVIRPLARGGMASVYEVEDEANGERVALKLLTQPGLAITRFNREYRALTKLHHPNIVRVYRFGLADDGTPYITMELLDGVAAQVYAKSCGRPGTPKRNLEVIRIVAAVCDALQFLHERGIVHRDLKSSNVMVQRDSGIKLLDFGTARLMEGLDQITRHGEFIGTFAYASPEQLTGGEITGQADLYSVGVLFYRLLTGKRPFEAEGLHEIARMHLEQDARPPGELASLPRAINDLVLNMLHKQPNQRPPGAGAVSTMLKGWIRDAGDSSLAEGLAPARLIGRDDELAVLRRFQNEPTPGAMALVTGAPGSGRMRLLQQVAMEARERGWRVYEAAFPGPPGLGAVGEVARLVTSSMPSEVPTQNDELLEKSATTDSELSLSTVRLRIFETIADTFARRVRLDRRPMALFFNDLHRAPPLAVQALCAVRQRAHNEGVPLILTCSATEESDAPGETLRVAFHDASRISLQPLTLREVAGLVASILGVRAPPPDLAQRIFDATGGMPGYVEEVVRAMVSAGMVEARPTHGNQVEWIDKSGGKVAIPGSAREAISLRLDVLPRSHHRLLEALAVAGGVAPSDVLGHAAEMTDVETKAVLVDLERERMVVVSRDVDRERWSFRLGLCAELVLERLRPSRRHVLERGLAEVMQGEPPSEAKARLMEAVGHVDKAINDAILWSVPLLDAQRGREVLPLLERLVERVAEVQNLGPSQVAQLYLCHGRALASVSPDDPRAEQSFARAQALGTGPTQRAEVDLHLAVLLRRRGQVKQAQELLERARARLNKAPDLRLRAQTCHELGGLLMAGGDHAKALAAFQESLRAGDHADDLQLSARARVGLGSAHLALGELTSAETDLTRAREQFRQIQGESDEWLVAIDLAELYRIEARYTEGLSVVETVRDAARHSGHLHRYALLLIALAELQIDMYRLGEAQEIMAEVLALGVAWHDPTLETSIARVHARLLLQQDEAPSALRVLDAAIAKATTAELSVAGYRLKALRGEAHASIGAWEPADRDTAEAVEGLRRERLLCALGEACGSRIRATQGMEDPDVVYAPLLAWFEAQPARAIEMAYLIYAAESSVRRGAQARADGIFAVAAQRLETIRSLLGVEERDGLEVHPWRTVVERASQR